MNKFGKLVLGLAIAAFATGFSVGEIQADTATNLKCKGCVGKKDLGKKSVKKGKIAKKAVTPENLVAPTGAAGFGDISALNIVAGQIVGTLKVRLPGAGIVIVDSVGYFRFQGADDSATCGLTADTTTDGDVIGASGSSNPTENRSPFAVKRTFEESSGGVKTYRLICNLGGGDNVDVLSTSMSAIYAPTNILVK